MTVQADDEAAIDLDGLLAGVRTVAEVNAMIRVGLAKARAGIRPPGGRRARISPRIEPG